MAIYMETTKIDPAKTLGEIQGLLAKAGVQKIQTQFDGGELCGLLFSIPFGGKELWYKLPARTDNISNYLQAKRGLEKYEKRKDDPVVKERLEDWKRQDKEQAKRIGWRQILRWLQAQLALMEVGMVDMKEVFLPYCLWNDNKTLYEVFEKDGPKLLEQIEA